MILVFFCTFWYLHCWDSYLSDQERDWEDPIVYCGKVTAKDSCRILVQLWDTLL